MSELSENIKKLRLQGYTYPQIQKELGCSKATISWHCSESSRRKSYEYRKKNRKKFSKELKLKFGGKCARCGYDECLAALHFHHKDPDSKTIRRRKNGVRHTVSSLRLYGNELALAEAEKCELICANCHFKEHYPDEETIIAG